MLHRRRLSIGAVPGAPGAHGAAAVRALRGEEVLAWTGGHERRDDGPGDIGGRKRLLRRGPTPGVPALLVVTQARRGSALRVHLLAEVGLSARSWPLADVRLVDGLDVPVQTGTDFALTFSGAPRPLFWRCDSAERRAEFLWSLFQVCAARLPGRAPPSQRLSLLELQTFAKEVAAAAKRRSADPSGASSPPGKKLGDKAEQIASPQKQPRRVTRTASEPQAGALHRLVQRTEAVNPPRRSVDGPLGVRPRATAEGERDMTVYEHAFALAARRIGARPPQFKRSRPQTPVQCDDEGESPLSAGGADIQAQQQVSSPERRALPRGPSATSIRNAIEGSEDGSATALLVAQCKAQEERRLFRMDMEDAEDLDYVLQLFKEADAEQQLSEFASWTLERMHEIEAANMAETAEIELNPQSAIVTAYRKAFVNTVTEAEPWLIPAEARLAPYAALIDDIRDRADMLDRHRTNVIELYDRLRDLLDNSLWSTVEEEQIVGVVHKVEKSPSALVSEDAFLFNTVMPAVVELAKKLNYAPDCTLLEEIAGFADTRLAMKLRRNELTSHLIPCFKERAVHLREGSNAPYMNCSPSFSFSLLSATSMSASRVDALRQRGIQERTSVFAQAVKSLSELDRGAALRLLDEYKTSAQMWTENALLKLKENIRDEIHEASVARPRAAAKTLVKIAETLSVLMVKEFAAADDLFSSACGASNALVEMLSKQFERCHQAVSEMMGEFGEGIAPKMLGALIFSSVADFFVKADPVQIQLLLQMHEAGEDEETASEVVDCQSPDVSRVTVSPSSSDQMTGAHDATRFMSPTRDSGNERMSALVDATSQFVSMEFRQYASTCFQRLQQHEHELLGRAKSRRDGIEEFELFPAVRDIVDACCALQACYHDLSEMRKNAKSRSAVLLQGALSRFSSATCERLVIGAIQHAEVSAFNANLRLQAYAYISLRILNPVVPLSTPPALAPVISLGRTAAQKRIQFIKRLIHQRALDPHFASLKALIAAPPFAVRKIAAAIEAINVAVITTDILTVIKQVVAETKGAVQADSLFVDAADVIDSYVSAVIRCMLNSDEVLKERSALKEIRQALTTRLLSAT